jgi:chromosome partitioning protein
VKVLAIANAKGGVTKTTVAVNVADGMARKGLDTLLVDLDPQGSATGWLMGLDGAGAHEGIGEALGDGSFFGGGAKRIHPLEGRPHLWLSPATVSLDEIDALLSAKMGGELEMSGLLERELSDEVLVGVKFHRVVIDCPPALSVSVLGALCASDFVITPVVSSVLALAGLRRMENVCANVRKKLKAHCELLGAVLTAADDREAITESARVALRKESAGKVFKSEIRVSTRAKALPGSKRTVWDGGDPRGRADFTKLLREIEKRMGV